MLLFINDTKFFYIIIYLFFNIKAYLIIYMILITARIMGVNIKCTKKK